MKKIIFLSLFCITLLVGCQNNDLKNNDNVEPVSNLESSTGDEKGSITNPYDGSNESFQITCQVPDYGKKSEIVLEFSYMELSEVKSGWLIDGSVAFISGNNTAPIHINDYVTFQYYNSDGIVRYAYNTLINSNTEGKEFVFNKNNLTSGSIHNLIKFEDLGEQVPKVACIRYYDGSDYKDVFFCRYEDGKPLGIED